MANFSLDSLSNDPAFNFLNILSNCSEDDNSFISTDSPYSCTEISCHYMCETEFTDKFSSLRNPTVLSLNIQSLPAKFVEFCAIINSLMAKNCAPDIICLQEIWRLTDSSFFNLHGYHPLEFKSRHNDAQGGGVGIYVKNNLNYTLNEEMSVFHDRILETIFVNVSFGSKTFLIGSVYRTGTQHPTLTPKDQFSLFSELLSSLSDQINLKKMETYIFGDINLDCLKYGTCAFVTDYVDLLFSHGMLQLITKPTRCTLTSATVIDHVITNSNCTSYASIILVSQISDHFPIFHFLSIRKPQNKAKTVSSRDFSDTNIGRFNDDLSAKDWSPVLSTMDAQCSYNNFLEIFSTSYDLHLPIISKKFNKNFHKKEPWMTGGLLTSRRSKIKLEKGHFASPSAISLQLFKNYRNIYNKLLRAAKRLYFEQELKLNQSNSKKSWELIKTVLNKKSEKNSSISNIIIDNTVITDPCDMSNYFNEFFTSVSSKIVDDINPSSFPPDDKCNDDIPIFSLNEIPVSATEIINATNLLQPKKTCDITGISVWLLQKIISSISAPLTHIFATSFSMGIVPQQLKTAKVIPVFKSGRKDLMDNYRPISLLSCFSKILEKIVCARLTNFLDTNNLITSSQFGFRKNHSTVHPLVHFLNFVSTSLDKKEHSIAIFCDLRKAFDTVDPGILLSKLKKMGIRGVELLWFQDYLTNRKQLVHINGSNSFLRAVLLGVPQGSILGPLLFLIYINDLPLCSELIALLFADDTTLLLSGPNIDDLVAKANSELKKITDFFRAHKLALHPEKTKFLLFTHSNEARAHPTCLKLDFNNNDALFSDSKLITNLTRVTSESTVPAIKFLGVFFFKFQINSVASKVSKSMFFLRSAKNLVSPQTLKTIYYAIVHPHFIYCIQIWSCTNPGNLKTLVLKQKNAIRIINEASFNAHTEPLFKKSKILPLPSLVQFFKLQIMHQFTLNALPQSFSSTWIRNSDRRNEDQPILRNHLEFFIPPCRLSSSNFFPTVNFPRTWCEFPDNSIKTAKTKNEFKSKLKYFFLEKLSSTVNCTRQLCPQCHLLG